jgi:hypothetical protein
MWACCGSPRKLKTFIFKNGTHVKARNVTQAREILKSISLREIANVFQLNSKIWLVDFGRDVTIEVQAPSLASAKKLGDWLVYLDRREPLLAEGQCPQQIELAP